MSFPLAGKVAIVTGSSRNIGAAIVQRLASDGASVVINYQSNQAAAQALADSINSSTQGKAVAIQGDMSKLEDGRRLVEEGVKAFGGRLDILCLNAGLMGYGDLEAITEEDFDKHFDINVKVPLFMTKAAVKYMGPGGRVLFFSTSITKFTSLPPTYLLYAATKGSVEQMVRVLAKDLGARGITVNAVAPGPTDTDLFRNGKNDQMIKYFENLHPAKRIARVEEISPVVAFLCRDEASWVNGQTHFVNGGYAV